MAFKTNLETTEAEAARLAQSPEGSTNHALSSMPVNIHGSIQDLLIELPSFEGDPKHTIVVVPFDSYHYGALDDPTLPRRRYNYGWSCIVVASDHPSYPVGGYRISLPEYQLRRGKLINLDLMREQQAKLDRVEALCAAAEEDRRIMQEGSPTALIAYPMVDADELRAAITATPDGTE